MSPENLNRMLEDYYRLNGWDMENGFPKEKTLKKLGLDFIEPLLSEKRKTATQSLPESCTLE